MDRVKVLRIVFFILMILTCITIFCFSNQNGEASKGVSGRVIRKVIDIFPGTKNKSEEEKVEITEQLQLLVRKLAHFSIYTILGITSTGFINTFSIKNKSKIGIAFLIGFIYAISDEIHQMFSFGRSARISDVCVDSCGVAFGIFLTFLVIVVYRKIKEKKLERSNS